jgi:hypothetical protein
MRLVIHNQNLGSNGEESFVVIDYKRFPVRCHFCGSLYMSSAKGLSSFSSNRVGRQNARGKGKENKEVITMQNVERTLSSYGKGNEVGASWNLALQQHGAILRFEYHRKQQRKKFPKACCCEP